MKTLNKMTLLVLIALFGISCGKDSEKKVIPAVDIKTRLVGMIWRFASISVKVSNGTIKKKVNVHQDGKNQYEFYYCLSHETYRFDADGKV